MKKRPSSPASPPPDARPPVTHPPAARRRLALRLTAGLCLASLGAGLLTHGPAHFGFDGFFGFHALVGFLACAALVLVAGLAGVLLGRGEDFYDR
ncbi:hypothetical protein [Desulfolutivibrio sulfodismutans]|nr:hypothetical protein [Desulfolutivibrio sulfodismutans]